MKRKLLIPILLALAIFAATTYVLIDRPQRTYGATPLAGAISAKAGSGGVTTKTFVKLSAAGTVVTATAVTDSVVGVCELTAAADALTRYAPVGTLTTVTSGELIAVGNLLTTGTGGKAFVLDVDDASSQRYAAVAMTAATGADEDVTVHVVSGTVEQRLNVTDLAVETLTVDDATTPTITLATGKTNSGSITINGKTSGSLVLAPIDDATGATVLINGSTAGANITFPTDTDTLVGKATTDVLTNKTVDGDDNTVQDLPITVGKVLVAGGDAEVGIPFLVIFEPAAAGTLSYTVPTGKKLRVLDAYGFKTVGAGAHADDELSLQNNDGSAANIFDKEELNAIGDKARILFDNLDDAERDVAATHTLDLVALENAAGGCDVTLYVLCVWVTP